MVTEIFTTGWSSSFEYLWFDLIALLSIQGSAKGISIREICPIIFFHFNEPLEVPDRR